MTCTAVRDKDGCFVCKLAEEEVWEVASADIRHRSRMEVWNNEPDVLLFRTAEEEGGYRHGDKVADFAEVCLHVV